MATLAVLAILASVSAVAFNMSQERTQSGSNTARLTSMQAAGRSVVALSSSEVPVDIVELIPGDGIKVVEGPSLDAGEFSVARLSSSVVAYAVVDGDGCTALIDDIADNVTTWVNDSVTSDGNCDAARIGLSTPTGGISLAAPATFDFDTSITTPGAPAAPSVTVLGTDARVQFFAPRNTGGEDVIEYTVACMSSGTGSPGGMTGSSRSLTVVDLTAGEDYTCTVKAANTRGYGEVSEPSDMFRPVTLPSAPTDVSVSAGNAQLTVSWTPVASSSSTLIGGYRVYVNDTLGCQSAGGAATSCSVFGLVNGSTYAVYVVAYSTSTEGVASSKVLARPRSVPGAPAGITVLLSQSAGSTISAVTFSAPASDGGSTITGYRALCFSSDGGTAGSSTTLSSPGTVTGLSSGKTYACSVAALNEAGYGPESAVSDSYLLAATPGAPTGAIIAGSSTLATVTFTAPVSNGGALITAYRGTCTSSNGGSTATASTSSSPVGVSGLTAGKSYTCTVAALNAAGYGSESAPTLPYTAFSAPSAVASPTATPGNGQVTVAWSPSSSTTTSPVEGYRVYRDGVLGCQVVGATLSSCTVAGLTNGTTYSFQLVAYYATTEGAASAPMSATPRTTPSAPAAPLTTISATIATVAGAAPVSNGGSAITGYRATCVSSAGGTTRTATGTTASIAVVALTATKAYSCTLAAQNAAGWSSESPASNAVTATSAPTAPLSVSATVSLTTASVTFSAPASNNGASISSYRATCASSTGGTTRTATGANSPLAVSGLSVAAAYTCTVAATNTAGWSSESSPSGTIVAYAAPSAPSNVVADPGSAAMTVTFEAPASDNGAAVTEYRATCTSSNGGTTQTVTAFINPVELTGLTDGKAYTCSVAAMNAAGWSPESAASTQAVPYGVPQAPTSVTVTVSTTTGQVAFIAHPDNGGATVTSFRTTCTSSDAGANASTTGAASPLAVGPLTVGKSYTCTVAALNAAGWSIESAVSGVVVAYGVPATPAKPAVQLAAGAGAAVEVTVAEVSGNGRPVTSYRAMCISSSGGVMVTAFEAVPQIIVENLTPAATYSCSIAAQNIAGWSDVSPSSEPITPYTTPAAVNTPAVVAGDRSVTATWAGLTTTSQAPISGYRVYYASATQGATLGCQVVGAITTSCAVTGLANGVTYSFQVAAYYTSVEGSLSGAATAVPMAVPGAPTAVTAVSSETAALTAVVTFTAPMDDGGSLITGYRATCASFDGGTTRTATGAASPISVPSLTATKSYSCTAAAQNILGYGAESAASSTFATFQAPGAPTAVTATIVAGTPTSATVAFAAPVSNGGATISAYNATCISSNGGTPRSGSAAASPVTVLALTAASTYTCTVTATNVAGTSAASAASGAVTAYAVPAAPTSVTVALSTVTPTSVTVSFAAAVPNNGSAVTQYRTTCSSSNGGTPRTATGPASPLTVTSLTAGTSYTCTAAAMNAAGYSTESSPSNSFAPVNAPGAPAGVTASPGNVQVTVSWTALTPTSATPVAGYRVYYSGTTLGCTAVGAASTSCVVGGLTNGTSYTFQVVAYYSTTEGALSSAVTATPRTTPGAPAISAATADTTSTALTITAPATNGSAITGYTANCTSSNGGAARSGTSTTLTVTVASLDAGKDYACSVTATNAAGTGAASTAKTLTAAQASSVSYSCPSGGTLSDTTCSVAASGWTATSYGASYACSGVWWDYTSTYALFSSGVGGPTYTAYDGTCYTAIYYNRKSDGGTCWSTPDGATRNGANKNTCSTTGLYKYVHQDYYAGNNRYYECPAGVTLSGSTCYPDYPDSGYYDTPASSYTATSTTTYSWNGWTIT